MSLMLRKECEPLMVQHDLDICYVDIAEGRSLKICTPCGKTLITVPGITFNRMQPTREEIEYAYSLLDNWLSDHKQLLDDYVQAFSIAQGVESPENSWEVNGIKISWERQWGSRPDCYELQGPDMRAKVTADGGFNIIEMSYEEPYESMTILAPITIEYSDEVTQSLVQNLAERNHYRAVNRAVSEALSELNKCEA